MGFYNLGSILFSLLNLMLLVGWIVLVVVALIGLRQRRVEPLVQVLWAFLIVIIPILGAVAFLIVSPGTKEP